MGKKGAKLTSQADDMAAETHQYTEQRGRCQQP